MFEDGEQAIALNDKYFKGFLRHGEAAIELGKHSSDLSLIDRGIKSLQKALYLCWKLEEADRNFSNKDCFQAEIGK